MSLRLRLITLNLIVVPYLRNPQASFACWPESPEAYYLFRPRGYDNRSSTRITGETPQDALNCHILLLQSGHSHKDNCRNVVVGRDADIFCTRPPTSIAHDLKFLTSDRELRSCAMAHTNLHKKMNQWTCEDCCREACKQLKSLEMNQATF